MNKKLPKGAYGEVSGKDYVPYITDKSRTGGNVAVLIIGIILAAIFAASTTYSGMKAGLTVAAGIPGAIIGSAFVGAFARQKGILGKNLIQGMSSGGESVASGFIFVLPAVILIGSQITFLEGLAVGVGGVFFGIGVAAIVHNYLIVEEHGKLMYPESMAISETLVASEAGGDSIKYMGIGFVISGFITVLTGSFLNVANNVMSLVGSKFYKWKFDIEVNPLLLGIGFIVGLEVSLTMFAGSILSNFGIAPLIGYFTDMAKDGAMVWNNPAMPLNQMDVGAISSSYVKYIGAGMMLCGGIIGAIKLIPTIIASIKETLKAKSSTGDAEEGSSIQMILLLGGVVVGFLAAFLISGNIAMAIIGAIISLLLSLLFVIVAGRLTGTIGTSNLPVSGMTIASLVIVTLVFVVMGWTDLEANKSLLLFGSFIVVAIAIAGGYTQSQKVTYIIGGSKNEMQRYFTIASIVGVIVVVGVILLLSDQLKATGDNVQFALPQANLMSTLTSGIMSGSLPWVMIIVGVFMAIVLYALKLPIMTIAIGFYLPIATTSIILVGALIRLFVELVSKSEKEKEAKVSNGISLSSGLVAGGSIIGLIGIILQVTGVITPKVPSGFAATNSMAIALLVVLVVLTALPIILSKVKNNEQE
ncbi:MULTISPECIES: OPT family oligopeptide transporter [unclassified Clostridioides]|uniref:OPT family oligopeptide transporter n=1 Tax=unclassified Clostridioides TaxID=2635829 RepID=UPI001D119AC8|nr:oligopeptide transporter, OPT family [Clostridioides sp. ZZV14-6150]MCC0659593.1 oligopeptide transporter, OPT family [Clostridioides sp. ZZV14-6154]MCC0666896.1 oligopeptide transporter, OPT family [Clostridioides sp. ZZV14-6153]MCC0718452.1 oligopeptide transporter, OPT family [Clostridioides sp. ZZV14-6105]MCC0723013.1 oligopeptide transporter, OPT family [Clostridioides sp. ZZV14-6104]MCC0725801.1 oligopeptide transporter, OPT family [Clostridioides sp. ZZV14-6045]MCC0729357.1 oligopep